MALTLIPLLCPFLIHKFHSRFDLHVLLADSSLRVKDVIKEFHAGGRLAQHSFGEVSLITSPTKQLKHVKLHSHFQGNLLEIMT